MVPGAPFGPGGASLLPGPQPVSAGGGTGLNRQMLIEQAGKTGLSPMALMIPPTIIVIMTSLIISLPLLSIPIVIFSLLSPSNWDAKGDIFIIKKLIGITDQRNGYIKG